MNERHAPPSSRPFLLAAYGIVAVLFLALHAAQIKAVLANPPGQIPIIDSRYYLAWAKRLLQGLGLGPKPFFMSPLYPQLIALAGWAGLAVKTGAFWLQSLLSLGSVLLAARYASRRFGPWAGVAASLLMTLYAPMIYYDAVLLSSSLILFLTLVALTLLEGDPHELPWWRAAAAGLAIGLSALARPNALLLVPAFALVLWLQAREKRTWGRIAALAVACVLMLLPPMIRNARNHGGFTLTTNSLGVNLFIGNSAHADGLYVEAPWLTSAEPIYEAEDYLHEAERRTGKTLTVSTASTYWTGQALRWIVHPPFKWAALEMRKFAYFFNRIEIANNVSLRGVAEYSPLLRRLRLLNFGLIAPLGLVGLLLTIRRRSSALPLALIASYLVANMLFFVSSEYRYPVVGVLIVYTIGALFEMGRRIRIIDDFG